MSSHLDPQVGEQETEKDWKLCKCFENLKPPPPQWHSPSDKTTYPNHTEEAIGEDLLIQSTTTLLSFLPRREEDPVAQDGQCHIDMNTIPHFTKICSNTNGPLLTV